MLLKAVGQVLGTARKYRKAARKSQRLLESLWAVSKGYRKAAGKCPNTSCQPIEQEAALPSGYRQKSGNFHSFL
jgi:hypothetical protein